MVEIFVSRSNNAGRYKLYPHPDPELEKLLEETGTYILDVVGLSDPDKTDLLFDGERLQALRSPSSDTGRWVWEIGYYAGDVQLTLALPDGARKDVEATVNPSSAKLQREHFDTMLREIIEDTFELFSMSGFRRSFARAAGTKPPPIARLEYIRSRISDVERSLIAINERPVHMLRSEISVAPFVKSRRLRGRDVTKSFIGGRVEKTNSRSVQLPSTMKGFYPVNVRHTKTIEDLNIAEHRQIKGCLVRWSEWLASVAQALEANSSPDEGLDKERKRWARRCRKLAYRLRRLLGLDFLKNIVPSFAGLTPSYIFSGKPAYRAFMRTATEINTGIAKVFGDFLDLPLQRTFDLYELWAYLRLVRAALKMNGVTGIDGKSLFEDPLLGLNLRGDQIHIDVGGGTTLFFQKTFYEYWKDANNSGTFTRPMRPDVSLFLDNGKMLVALDAKYRVGKGLNEAVSSIHTYRDALVQEENGEMQALVKGAYLISPFKLVTSNSTDWRQIDMPSRLFHPVYRGKFRFGAIALIPGVSLEQVVEILKGVIIDMSPSPA